MIVESIFQHSQIETLRENLSGPNMDFREKRIIVGVFEGVVPLRGYCTPTRKLACFVCFLLHREKNQYFLCMVVIDVCD